MAEEAAKKDVCLAVPSRKLQPGGAWRPEKNALLTIGRGRFGLDARVPTKKLH